jgi:hypothetical protein
MSRIGRGAFPTRPVARSYLTFRGTGLGRGAFPTRSIFRGSTLSVESVALGNATLPARASDRFDLQFDLNLASERI